MSSKFLDKTGLDTLWAKIKSTFQTLGNLVTAWGSTPSDTKYPSEKLVKTSLDAKAPNAVTTEAAIATGDKLLFSDASDSSKTKRMGTSFDTGVTTTMLRRDGTFARVLYADEAWGGAFRTSLSPFDNYAFKNANCFFGAKASAIRVEYSNDGGTTWLDYGMTDAYKQQMFSQYGTGSAYCGKNTHIQPGYTGSIAGTKDLSDANIADQRLRITICESSLDNEGTTASTDRWLYCNLRRIGIYMSTQSAGGGAHCLFEKRTRGNFKNGIDTWTAVGDYKIQGDSGWNSIPCGNATSESSILFGANADSTYAEIRFTIWSDKLSAAPAASQTGNLCIYKIVAYSELLWANNSTNPNMGNYGVPYTVSQTSGSTYFSKGITSGVAIPVSSGGTGKASVTAGNYLVGNGTSALTEKTPNVAANDLINALTTGEATPTGDDYYVAQYAGGGTTTKTFHRRPVKALWEYIKTQISSVLGLTADSYGGNAATATTAAGYTSGGAIDTALQGKATPADIASAIQALDVASQGGDGKYIKAISEADGKISATAETMDTAPTANSTKAVTSGGVKTALDGKQDDLGISSSGDAGKFLNMQGSWQVPPKGDEVLSIVDNGTTAYGFKIATTSTDSATNYPTVSVTAIVSIRQWTSNTSMGSPWSFEGFLELFHRRQGSGGTEVYFGRLYTITSFDGSVNKGWRVYAVRNGTETIDWYIAPHEQSQDTSFQYMSLSFFTLSKYTNGATCNIALSLRTTELSTFLTRWVSLKMAYLPSTDSNVGSATNPVYVGSDGQLTACKKLVQAVTSINTSNMDPDVLYVM